MTKNKGVALILSVIILTAVLAIALTAGKIFTDKIKMSRSTSDSMKAYYAAESGIEWALHYTKTHDGNPPTCPGLAECLATVDGASYEIQIDGQTIKAIGKAGGVRRGVKVQVAQAAGASFGVVIFTNINPGPTQIATVGPCLDAGYTGTTGLYYVDGVLGLSTGQAVDAITIPGNDVAQIQCYK